MKNLIVIALAFFLASCGTQFGQRITDTISAAQNFSITQGQLDGARNGYDGAVLAPLHTYSELPRCKTRQTISINNPCHDRVLLKKIRAVDAQVDIAFSNTQDRITSGDSKGAVAAYATLTDAIALAKSLIAQSGVNVLGF